MKKKIFALTLCLAFIITALCVQFVSALPDTREPDVSRQSRSVDEYRKVLDAVSSGKRKFGAIGLFGRKSRRCICRRIYQ